MKKRTVIILFFIFLFKSNAQQDLVSINDTANPESSFGLEQLIEEVLVSGGCSGVSNFSSQTGGAATDLINKSYGYFSNGTAIGFPFEEGIVLTTGLASEGGNTYIPNPPSPRVFPDNNIGIQGDADIENVLGINNTNDATFVKFNFVPTSNTINFRFIMASEEYDGNTECDFTDGFAFLLREVGAANYTNIAVLPDGTPVSVKTINNAPGCAANMAFFAGYEIRDTNYGGRTIVLNATSPVIPGTNYEIKLVIADQGDANKDSAIFLEAGSFDLGGDLGEDITIANGTAVCTGQSITLSTQAATATHKWYLNGIEIPGAGIGETLTVIEPGTYSVDINFSSACIVNDSIVVEFKPVEDASFTTTPTCDGATVTITGDVGGVFSFNPVPADGATIDAALGTITNGTVGESYTIEYTTLGDCFDTKSNTVTIASSGDATFTTTATCDGATAIITGDIGGVFSFDPVPAGGAVIDASTGTVTGGISGITYTIKYSTPGVCGIASTQGITVLDTGNATFTVDPRCDGGFITITGDTGGLFTFDPIPTDGAVIDATTGTITGGVQGTTYTIKYTISGICGAATTQEVTLLSGDSSFILTPTCDGAMATITGVLGGIFVFFDFIPTDGAKINSTTGEVTGAVLGTTYTIEYGTGAECEPMSIQSFTPLTSSNTSFTTIASCEGGTVTITGDTGGVFSFDPIPTDGTVIDARTGTVTRGVSGTTYTIRYKISGTCGSSTNQDITVLETGNATFTTSSTCDGGTVTITGDVGGLFTFDPIPTDGAVIDATTGTITGGVQGTTYTIKYTISGICGAATTKQDVTLLSGDSSFILTPTCDGAIATITGVLGGVFVFFDFIPTDGATINSTTGEVTGAVLGTTYTIEYGTGAECGPMSIQSFTPLTSLNTSFTTIASCEGGTITITGDVGGLFTFDPIPTDGAVIDETTGTVTVGVSGTTYTIKYTISGTCVSSTNQDITVLDTGNATFTVDSRCDGGFITITGDTGGLFTFDPIPTDGAVIDATTGTITGGIQGTTYTIKYTISGICGATTTQNVTLLSGDSSFILTPTCDGAIATITGILGGVFVFFDFIPTDGATINSTTGEVTGAVLGTTYTIEYGTGAECGPMSIQSFTPLTSLNTSFTTIASCDGGTVTIIGDTGGLFTFDPIPTDGAVIDATTGTVTGGVSGTTYTIKYTISGTCVSSTNQDITVLETGNATFTISSTCDGGTVTITGDAGGLFTFDPVPTDGAVIETTTGTITGGTSESLYTIRYTTSGACGTTTTQSITVLPIEDASFTLLETCEGGTAFIAGDIGGVFVFNPVPNDGATIDAITGAVIGLSGITYIVNYTTGGECSSTSIQNVTVLEAEDPSFITQPNCDGGTVTITGDTGGVFTFNTVPNDGAVIDAVTGTITNGASGETYTIEYTTTGTCTKSSIQDVTVYLVPVLINPVALVSCDEDTLGDSATFDLESKNDEISDANSDYRITYHETLADADLAMNPLLSPYVSASRTVYVRAENRERVCFSTTELDLEVEQSPTITPSTYSLCDDTMEFDGDATNDSVPFNLESQNVIVLNGQDPITNTVSYYENQADAEAEINGLTSPYENIINPQVIIVRVNNNSSTCYAIGELTLEVNPIPSFDLKDNYTVCIDADGSEVTSPPIIDTDLNTADYSFEWYLNGTIITGATSSSYLPTQAGTYNVIVITVLTGCSTNINDPNTVTEVNESARPFLTASQVSIAFVERNNILATAASIDPLINGNVIYEFSLDGGQWFSNTPNDSKYLFENVRAGVHIVEARDVNGCGITSVTLIVLDYPLYFTPNNDGFHDTWNIVGLENQPNVKLYVFNRYGKLLKQLNPNSLGWDGTFNNQLMPSNDYWFKLEYNDPNTNERSEFKSHFALKR